jgi:hypothetical protein
MVLIWVERERKYFWQRDWAHPKSPDPTITQPMVRQTVHRVKADLAPKVKKEAALTLLKAFNTA